MPWLHLPNLLVPLLTYLEVDTVVAYDADAIYVAKVPMILQVLGDGTIWSIVAAHTDEYAITTERVISRRLHDGGLSFLQA